MKKTVLSLAVLLALNVSAKDAGFEPQSHYDMGKYESAGGKIVAVSFEANCTLVTIRVVDEDNVVSLPPKAELEKKGLKTSKLKPGNFLQVDGHPHKTDKLKMWGESASVTEG